MQAGLLQIDVTGQAPPGQSIPNRRLFQKAFGVGQVTRRP